MPLHQPFSAIRRRAALTLAALQPECTDLEQLVVWLMNPLCFVWKKGFNIKYAI